MARDYGENDDIMTQDQLAAEGQSALEHEQRQRKQREGKAGRRSPFLFFRQVVAELRKVVWPNRQQLITYSTVVVVFVSVVMAFVFILDFLATKGAFWLFA